MIELNSKYRITKEKSWVEIGLQLFNGGEFAEEEFWV